MELLLPNKVLNFTSTDNVFTFQYGATSTTKKLFLILKLYQFTFQYGATSTDQDSYGNPVGIGFTFQYGATSTQYRLFESDGVYFIYIPIWSYFYAHCTT